MMQQHQHNPEMLRTCTLTFSYADSPLFVGLELCVPAGVTLVKGERGKTTLLRLLAGDLSPQAGWIAACGVRQDQAPDAYRKLVFWNAPDCHDHDQKTPREIFRLFTEGNPRADVNVAHDVARRLMLEPHLDKAIYMLSSGSKRKVWISAAFASGAPVVLIDDLFAALDRPSIDALSGLLAEQSRGTQRAWLIAHHDVPAGVPLAAIIDLDVPAQGLTIQQ